VRLVAVSLLLVLTFAAGCGGGDGDQADPEEAEIADRSVPTDEYVTKADDVCRDVGQRVLALREELRTAQNRSQAADILARQLEIVRDMRRRLAALGAPDGNREVAEELIADIADAEPHLQDTIDALRDGDEQRANEAGQRYAEASIESARQVRDSGLDFEVCGSGA
jgi:TolA-binding protein